MIEGSDGFFDEWLSGDVIELSVFEDDFDGQSFSDLCFEVFDHAAFDESCSESPGVVSGLHGHHFDFAIEVIRSDFDVFFFGDPIQDEVFLDGLPGGGDGVLSDLVFTGLDFLRCEPGLLHFEDFSSQRIIGLLGDEFFGQFPIGAFGNAFEDLAPGLLSLSEFGLSLECFSECILERVLVFDSEPIEEFLVEVGQVSFLDGFDRESQAERFASHGDVFGFGGDSDFGGPLITGGDTVHELIEAFELCVLEPEDGAEVEHSVVDGPHRFVAVVEFEVGDDGVAGCGGTIVIVEVRVLQQELLQVVVDIFVGDVSNGPIDGESLVVGQVEFGPNLDIEFVFEVPVLGDFDHVDIEVRFVDRFEVVFFGELFEASDEHFLFDFIGEFSPKTFGDQPGRHMSLAEPGDFGRAGQFSDGEVVHRIDIPAWDSNDNVSEAGAG